MNAKLALSRQRESSKLQEVHVEETSRLEQDQSVLDAGSIEPRAEECQRSFGPSGVVTCDIKLSTSKHEHDCIDIPHPVVHTSSASKLAMLRYKYSIQGQILDLHEGYLTMNESVCH